MSIWDYCPYRVRLSHPGLVKGPGVVWDSCHLYWGVWTLQDGTLWLLHLQPVRSGKPLKTTRQPFFRDSLRTLWTLSSPVFTPIDCRNFSPSFSHLSLDSVLIRMMYGCGLFRTGGIVRGTLITINRAKDFKQNHTPVKGLFLLSVHHARLVLGFTQVCVCVYICVCMHTWMWAGYLHAYAHTCLSINIADEQYRNKCHDTGHLLNKSDLISFTVLQDQPMEQNHHQWSCWCCYCPCDDSLRGSLMKKDCTQ